MLRARQFRTSNSNRWLTMARVEYWPRYGLENYTFVFPFEKSFDSVQSTKWMQHNWLHSVSSSVLYVIAIYAGQKIMQSRKPYSLRIPLILWNFCLAVFSVVGVLRMSPEMWWSVTANSLEYSICTASFAQGVTGFWTEMFAMSKIMEFGDTAFLVLRKRPLLFLHWYHHVTVLVYTWHAYKDHTASGRWFIWMNYTVHAFMYTYYALRALHIRLPKVAAMMLTVLQILQMVGGVTIGISILNIKLAGRECQQTWENLYFSFTIYLSYFLLFCNFFYHAYIKKNNRYESLQKEDALKTTNHLNVQGEQQQHLNGMTTTTVKYDDEAATKGGLKRRAVRAD